ncbi:MAG: serine hydrolase [Pseudomonadota bacterium]
MKKFILGLGALPVIASLALLLSGHGYIFTALARTYLAGHATANIDDHTVFDTRNIDAGDAQPWPLHPDYRDALPDAFATSLVDGDAVAFLVVHQGKLLAEQYFQGYAANSRTNSFSMAKTVLTLLVGRALEDGIIGDLEQPLTALLPEFSDDPMGQKATLGSLSTMTSGYDWDEHYYSPFSPTVELLYGDDVESFVLGGRFSHEPETHFYYSSASTQLLAVSLSRALERARPGTTLSDYLSETLWQPLGMNDDAVWHIDGEGMELAYCCINTNARNYAKLGQLLLQDGNWDGRQLIDAGFIERMRTPRATDYYGYSTWMNYKADPAFYYFSGHLGQFIIVAPEHDLVVVRLGRTSEGGWKKLEDYVAGALALLPDAAPDAT